MNATADRCPAAHFEDPTPCDGPPVVTVLDKEGESAEGCEHHAVRLLAALYGGQVHPLPDAPHGVAIRVYTAAQTAHPYPWAAVPAPTPEPEPEIIRYTADVVAVRGMADPGARLLTIRRGSPPHQGALALPGGHVDAGETSRAAAVRELREETGVTADEEDLILIGVFDAPGRDPRGRYVSVAYAVTVPDDTTATAADDADAVAWVPLDDPGPLAFDHSEIVAAARRFV